MKKIIYFILPWLSTLLGFCASAQENVKPKSEKKELETITIIKSGEKDTTIVLKFDDGNITINGKPIIEFNDKDGKIKIESNKIIIDKNFFGDQIHGYFDEQKNNFRHQLDKYNQGWKDFNWNNDGSGNITFSTNDTSGIKKSKTFLGVSTEKENEGAKIINVTENSAADKAGLKVGDIITSIGKDKINNPSDLSEIVTKYKKDDKVKIYYTRDGKEMNVQATLGERKLNNLIRRDITMFPKMPVPPNPPNQPHFGEFNSDFFANKKSIGIKIEDTKDESGVTVISLDENGPAKNSGIQKGDVLIEMNGQPIENTEDATGIMRSSRNKAIHHVKIKRNGITKEIDIIIPKKLKTVDL